MLEEDERQRVRDREASWATNECTQNLFQIGTRGLDEVSYSVEVGVTPISWMKKQA